jgi:hypothetical protein
METLQDAQEKICDLKGSVLAMEALTMSVLRWLAPDVLQIVRAQFASEAETARALLLGAPVSEHTLAAFERDVQRASARLDQFQEQP